MPARLIAYPPDNAAIIRLVPANARLRIGRARDCELVLDHASVSREHAELRAEPGHWLLRDLGSKNGSHVDGTRIDEAPLIESCWLRFGDVHCEFAPLTEAAVAEAERQQGSRRNAATAHTVRLGQLTSLGDLLDASLTAVLELTQCTRGFVLLGQGESLAVRASLSLSPASLATREFSGSVGAVRRAMYQRRIIVANDIRSEAWLASRDSVMAAGLSALACVPLMENGQVLGAIYADRVTPGVAITTLDMELLHAFAENAAVWIAARRTSEQLDAMADAADWSQIVAAHDGRSA
ncbi:MAG: FHA domain-containing protein [Pseudomonadota bacterium]|nr:FHA domain-containing protein [Pseudomonadota bacterium]